jgi:hypothetical protein
MGGDGNLVHRVDGDTIGRITPRGVIASFPAVAVQLAIGITASRTAASGSRARDKIGRITPSGTVSEFSVRSVVLHRLRPGHEPLVRRRGRDRTHHDGR